MDNSKYTLKIDLNVLNHLGLNLYSNVPAVLSELIANAWDADSTEVKIIVSNDKSEIRIEGQWLWDVSERPQREIFEGRISA